MKSAVPHFAWATLVFVVGLVAGSGGYFIGHRQGYVEGVDETLDVMVDDVERVSAVPPPSPVVADAAVALDAGPPPLRPRRPRSRFNKIMDDYER